MNLLAIRSVRTALADLATAPTPSALATVYRLVRARAVFGSVDDEATTERGVSAIRPERRHALGLLFAGEAPDINAARFGLALLATAPSAADRELVVDLGVHPELTDAAAAVFSSGLEVDEAGLFELAKRVDGWPRVLVVERLLETTNPTICAWLLREGFRTSVGHEPLAYICAVAGDLHTALARSQIDAPLLRGAAEIFVALANGSAAGDLDDYEFRDEAVRNWLRHLRRQGLDLYSLTALDCLYESDLLADDVAAQVAQLRAGPDAGALIHAGLDWPESELFQMADIAAMRRGLTTFEVHERRVRCGARGRAYSIPRMLEQSGVANIERALDAVRSWADVSSVRSSFAAHEEGALSMLANVVLELYRYPGKGADFIHAALRSPTLRLRRLAVEALKSWPPAAISAALRVTLVEALERETAADLSAALETLSRREE